MSPEEVQILFAGLQYQQDRRNPPDNLRRGRFRNGWEDASIRRQDYSTSTLRHLTWHNLGYRFGKLLGPWHPDQIEEVYQMLATMYTNPENVPEVILPSEENGEVIGASDFDWQAEVQAWCRRRRNLSPVLTDIIITFFRLSFQHTRCPKNAWFGCHPSGISLVIGGVYLAAIHRTGNDAGLWLIVDQNPPQLSDLEYRPIRSAQHSQDPLLWAHATSLEVLPNLIECSALWDSFRVATERIRSSSRSASNRDEVQVRRKKRRLSEFWPPGDPVSVAEATYQPAPHPEQEDEIADVERDSLTEQSVCVKWSNRPSVSQYVAGLKAISSQMNDLQRRILIAQYYAPQRTAYATQLARLANVPGGYPSVNANYGRLGHLFCDATDLAPDVRKDGTWRWWAVWSIGHPSPKGFIWEMLTEVAVALEQLGWVNPPEFVSADEVVYDASFVEGAMRQITVNAYERNEEARQQCLAHYGTKCRVCCIDFGATYGEVGTGYIHVHHLRRLADIGSEYKVDPVTDLAPVCPNCHAIIHRRTPPYSIEDVKAMLRGRLS